MFKKIASTVLIVALAGALLLVAGCEKDEITVTTDKQIDKQIVEQHEVVE